jgi:hypothetical protein
VQSQAKADALCGCDWMLIRADDRGDAPPLASAVRRLPTFDRVVRLSGQREGHRVSFILGVVVFVGVIGFLDSKLPWPRQ